MINSTIYKPVLKQNIKLTLKAVANLENIDIYALPSRINDDDIIAMFKGLLRLVEEKANQQQTEKYLKLKLQYTRLKHLYNKKITS